MEAPSLIDAGIGGFHTTEETVDAAKRRGSARVTDRTV
jgi:hypothetical protein